MLPNKTSSVKPGLVSVQDDGDQQIDQQHVHEHLGHACLSPTKGSVLLDGRALGQQFDQSFFGQSKDCKSSGKAPWMTGGDQS